jgi:hypothetical protein
MVDPQANFLFHNSLLICFQMSRVFEVDIYARHYGERSNSASPTCRRISSPIGSIAIFLL